MAHLTGIAALVLGAASATAGAPAVEEVLATKLQVVTEYGCAVLLIDVRNERTEPAYLPPEEPFVRLRHESGEYAPYFPESPIIDRPPYRLDEHVRIEPGQRHRTAIDLNRFYGLKKGWYAIRLVGGYWDPIRSLRVPGRDAMTRFYYGGHCRPSHEVPSMSLSPPSQVKPQEVDFGDNSIVSILQPYV